MLVWANLVAAVSLSLIQYNPGENGEQPTCFKRDEVIKALTEHTEERLFSQAVTENGWLMETFVAPNGEWTVFFTTPDKISCLVAGGNSYTTQVPRGAPGRGT